MFVSLFSLPRFVKFYKANIQKKSQPNLTTKRKDTAYKEERDRSAKRQEEKERKIEVYTRNEDIRIE